MCHSDDSRPPGPPLRGEVGVTMQLELTAADGNRFAAYRATPRDEPRAGMVILPDIRGLHPFYKALAKRFAEAGYDAIAFDFFGRTAGVGERDEDFDWKEHVGQVTPAHVRADAQAALEKIQSPGRSAFTVGFCFGGGHSWRLAATDIPISGAIGFYGRPALVSEAVDDLRAPLLMLIAGNDAATPLEDFRELDARLSDAGKEHEMHVYEGAPHSFFDRAFDEWQDACSDAWERILAFTEEQATNT
ncbi:MAG: carboxymethylenebutenolidase [Actinomycetota bacterium]|nr:carboxymethylenebutenolidase [Actinomycetota bacterium]